MKVYDRIILSIFLALIVAFMAFAIVAVSGVFELDYITEFFRIVYENILYQILICVGLGLVAICAFLLMFIGIKKGKAASVLIKTTDNGNIKVSLRTVESIAVKCVRETNEVKEVKLSAEAVENGLNVNIFAAFTFDTNIPEITATIQNNVKERVENLVGVQVKQVNLTIDNSIISNN